MRPQPKKQVKRTRKCIIATGSNILNSLREGLPPVEAALKLLSSESVEIISQSPLYKTKAFPAGSGPDFTNGAVLCETTLSAQGLLAYLHKIESQLGRTRSQRWEPRIIDLDLIDFDGTIAPDPVQYQKWRDLPLENQMKQAPETLILPHPRLQERVFVLVPMRDIAPDWVHPVSGKTLDQLLSRFSKAQLAEIRLA